MGWMVNTILRPFYPWKRFGTDCTGDWLYRTASLADCRKSRPQRNSTPLPPSPYTVAIQTVIFPSGLHGLFQGEKYFHFI
jgi:hypothetical protein